MLNQDLAPLIIKARCPQCFKLYAVDAVEIRDAKPQFSCSKCQTHFWFPFPECLEQKEVLGFPVDWLNSSGTNSAQSSAQSASQNPSQAVTPNGLKSGKTAARTTLGGLSQKNNEETAKLKPNLEKVGLFSCPRCQAHYSGGDTECPKCGVVFSKLEIVEQASANPGSPGLKRMWRQVMDNYGQIEIHRKFVQAAQKENNLVFASQQYRKLLSAHSGDETALRMQKEIVALTQVISGVATSPPKPTQRMNLMPRLTTMILVGGGALIAFGLMIDMARNLTGLGVALVFFTLAAKWLVDR